MMVGWLKVYCTIFLCIASGWWSPQSAISADARLISSVAREYSDGSDMCILKSIARKLALPLEIKFSPFKRRLSLMEQGELDLLPGLLKSPERERYIYYIDTPYKKRSDTVFFVKRGRSDLIGTYEDLYSLRIGTITGSRYFPRFDSDTRLDLHSCSNSESNFKKVMAGRIDAAAFPESVGIDLIDRMGINASVVAANYRFAGEKHVYFGISKRSWLMNSIQTVEETIRSMIESGELEHVIVKHYTDRGLPIPAM